MNSTLNAGGVLGSESIGGFAYGIGVSVGILLLITTITLASYFCARARRPNQQQLEEEGLGAEAAEGPASVAVGMDEAAILTCPKMMYSEAKKRDSTASCCSICLADYKGSDELRVLPDCGHLFHCTCVDPWLRLHPTCPVCRTSPLSTPLAEVVPLASRRD